jgi:hypothetical protein
MSSPDNSWIIGLIWGIADEGPLVEIVGERSR